jgi:RNA polymerase sigma-54 factor
MSDAAAAPPRAAGHARREDRHRAPAAAAEPSGARDGAPARHDHRGAQAAHRDHPRPRSEAGRTTQSVALAVRKFRSALWLLKSVDQRQKTIFKVARSIINFQTEFLDHGIEHLKPLVLRDVANDIGMHESTVSRVVNNKYMHTPQGVFEMKFFFHSGISSSFGEHVSSVTIKNRIRKIIDGEDARKPLSDSKIVSILQKEGLILARRTIAKYREELKIPTSNQRKVLY